jgi:AcrR family transcriptional regulator
VKAVPIGVAAADLLADPIAPAVLATIRERGYPMASVEEFAARASLGREDFDRRFSGKQEVTELVLEAHISRYLERVGGAFAQVDSWPGSLRAAAYETARHVLENPDATWFLTVGVLAANDMARARRDQLFDRAAGLVDAGRGVAADPGAIPTSTAALVVGAAVEALRRAQMAGKSPDFGRSLPGLMYLAVRPYLGDDAARAELQIEPPPDLLR